MAPKYPSIPEPTIEASSLRDAVLTIKQAFEVLTGQRGNEDYRAVLLPELTASDNADDAAIAANAAAIAANAAAIAAHTTAIAANTTAINGKVSKAGDSMSGSLLPSTTNAIDLGGSLQRWRTIYTSDLDLSNGIGDWTIVEGADDLFIYNNKKNRVYKFALIEVERGLVPPKKD